MELYGVKHSQTQKVNPADKKALELARKYEIYKYAPISPINAIILRIKLSNIISDLKRQGATPQYLENLNRIVRKLTVNAVNTYQVGYEKRKMYPFL